MAALVPYFMVCFSVYSSFDDRKYVKQFDAHSFLSNGNTICNPGDSAECFDWNSRFKVAVGIADGLKYLHYDCQKRIIHRDITASNILLMEDYQPQVAPCN